MEKLLELAKIIHCEFNLELNPHKGMYEDASKYFNEDKPMDALEEIDWSKDIWHLQVYVNTPISFYSAFSNNLEALVDWAIENAKEDVWPEAPEYMLNKGK